MADPYCLPSPSTCEDFLLTFLHCLELTIAAHQPVAKPYSTVVTVAVCLHEAGEPSLTITTTAYGGERSHKYKLPSFPVDCIYWIMTLKGGLRPVKRNSELRHVSRKHV